MQVFVDALDAYLKEQYGSALRIYQDSGKFFLMILIEERFWHATQVYDQEDFEEQVYQHVSAKIPSIKLNTP